MALIKCNECKKEISDKAKTCPNCGCPIFKESVKNIKKKKWEDLTNEEKWEIIAYRKIQKNWWSEGGRAIGTIFVILGSIFLLIFFISGLKSIFLFYSFIPIGIGVVFTYNSMSEQKKWYEKHMNELYENEIIK